MNYAARIQALADQQAAKRKAAADRNRAAMPNVAAVVDQFNAYFGPVKVLGAEDLETGKKIGRI